MYYVLLDGNNFYTGVYSKYKLENGVEVETLPPEENQRSYKLVEESAIVKKTRPVRQWYKSFQKTVTDDEGNEEVIKDAVKITAAEAKDDPDAYEVIVTDENGTPVLEEYSEEVITKKWEYDETKNKEIEKQSLLALKNKVNLRLNEECTKAISKGIDLETSQGTEHFSLTDVDQLNIKAIYDIVKSGAKSALYHADGKLCRVFTDEEIIKLMEASMKYVTYNTTLCNHLHVQVSNAKTKENIVNVEFSVNSLKDTYKESFNTIVIM